MSTPKFKNTSGAIWADLLTPATKWRFDTYGVTPKIIECTFEPLECVMAQTPPTFISGVAAVVSTTPDDVTLTVTQRVDITGTAAITSSTPDNVELRINWNEIDCQFEYLICEGQGNMGLDCTFEFMTCGMDSLFGADIEGSFQELDMLGTLRYCKSDLKPLFQKLDCDVYAGCEMYLTFNKLSMTGQGFINLEGEIQAATQVMTFESHAGGYLVAEFDAIDFIGQATVPLLGRINIQTRSFQCEMWATTESIDVLVASFRKMTMTGAATTSATIGTGGDLVATMRNMEAVITGIQGQVCDLEVTLPKLLAEMLSGTDEAHIVATLESMTAELEVNDVSLEASLKPLTAQLISKYDHLTASFKPLTVTLTGYTTGENILEAEFEELTLVMYSFTLTPPDGETCEPYETLQYEEVV